MGFPIQNFKIHFIGIFHSKCIPAFSGPRAWVALTSGGASGCSACARDARFRRGKHPEQQYFLRLQLRPPRRDGRRRRALAAVHEAHHQEADMGEHRHKVGSSPCGLNGCSTVSLRIHVHARTHGLQLARSLKLV